MRRILVLIVGFVIGVMVICLRLPQEVAFKKLNGEGIQALAEGKFAMAMEKFEMAQEKFVWWALRGENNRLGVLYVESKYAELEAELAELMETDCDWEAERISADCENVYYLDGLVRYRLGEKVKREEQKEYYEESIVAFRKVLALNEENTWAQENIDFIMQKYYQDNPEAEEQKQQQEQQAQSGEESGESGEQQQQQLREESEELREDAADQGSSGEDGGEEGKEEGSSGQTGEEQEERGEEGQGASQIEEGGESEQSTGAAAGESGEEGEGQSRLPSEMQESLEQLQEQLDEQNQQGFNRSQSSAEQQQQQNQNDPFANMRNDPFFQEFFGNDPFLNQQFDNGNLNKNLPEGEDKDW